MCLCVVELSLKDENSPTVLLLSERHGGNGRYDVRSGERRRRKKKKRSSA